MLSNSEDTFAHIMAPLRRQVRFVFVRHGQSEGNVAKTMQGHLDRNLTTLGRRQAIATAAWIRSQQWKVAATLASPLARAQQTAAILCDGAALPRAQHAPEAIELHTGVFTGLDFEQIAARFPDAYAAFQVDSWEAVPEAESIDSLWQRAAALWRRMVRLGNTAAFSDPTVVCVSHGGMLQWIVKRSFGPEGAARRWMPLTTASNCGVFEYVARPVRTRDSRGDERRGYYGQWAQLNFRAQPDLAPISVRQAEPAREVVR